MLGEHGFGGGFMWIIWILVLFLIVWVIRSALSSKSSTDNSHKSALDILKERYARGDISHDEFEQKKKVIGG